MKVSYGLLVFQNAAWGNSQIGSMIFWHLSMLYGIMKCVCALVDWCAYMNVLVCLYLCLKAIFYSKCFNRLLQEKKFLQRIWGELLCIARHQEFQIILLKVFTSAILPLHLKATSF